MKKISNETRPFAITRQHHQRELAEDYVELINDLLCQKGKARICEIARMLGVSHVTVIRTIERLQKQGYLNFTSRHPISLTEKGLSLASSSKKKHLLLIEYLTSLGVPKEIAAIDAEGMEHHISPQTLKALEKHLLNLSQ